MEKRRFNHGIRNGIISLVLCLLAVVGKGQDCPFVPKYTITEVTCNGNSYDLTFTLALTTPNSEFDRWEEVYCDQGIVTPNCTSIGYLCFIVAVVPPPPEDPVCGCNGKDYLYSFCAEGDGIYDYTSGFCPTNHAVTRTITGIPSGQGATGSVNVIKWNGEICNYTFEFPAFYCTTQPVCTGNPLSYSWLASIYNSANCITCPIKIYKRKYLNQDVIEVRRLSPCTPLSSNVYDCIGNLLFSYVPANAPAPSYYPSTNVTQIWDCTLQNSCANPPAVNISGPAQICAGSTATLAANASGGVSPYLYQWNTNATTNSIQPTTSGVYTVTITGADACTATATRSVTVVPAITVTDVTTNNLSGTFRVQGGLPQSSGGNYTSVSMALFNNPAVTATLTTAPFTHNEVVSFTVPQVGTYIVTATDAGGCSGTGTVVVTNVTLPCWEYQQLPTSDYLSGVYFIDSLIGFVSGGSIGGNPLSGSIFKTTNGGISWQKKYQTTIPIGSIFFYDINQGWATGASGNIFRTTDGGETWLQIQTGFANNIYKIKFINPNRGWACGYPGVILTTTNGGSSWTQQYSTPNSIFDIEFVSAQKGWAVGANNQLLQTINGGITWVSGSISGSVYANSIDFATDSIGLIAGAGFQSYKTQNQGTTWELLPSPAISGSYEDCIILDRDEGYLLGQTKMAYSRNGGTNWLIENLPNPVSNEMKEFYILNKKLAVAVGRTGSLVRFTGGTPQCVSLIEPINGSSSVSPETIIRWNTPQGCISGYEISIATTLGGNDILSKFVLTDTFYQHWTPFPEGKTIYIRVTAFNLIKEASNCQEFSFSTLNSCTLSVAPLITGDTILCNSATSNLQVNGTYVQYYWTGGASTATINVNQGGNYAVTVTDNNGCTGTAVTTISEIPKLEIINSSSTDLSGTFTVFGGRPQTNGSNYASVTMSLQGSPAIAATLTTAPFTHNETVSFTVPQSGMYIVTATDGAGCSATDTIVVSTPQPPEMVFIQGGTFTMGCTAEQQPDCFGDESPAHQVTLTDFYMGKYEVTQGQWESLMGYTQAQMRDFANPALALYGVGNTYPIYYISWYDAAVFCNRLSEQQGYTPCYYADAGYTQVYGKSGSTWSLPNTGTVYWKPDAKGYRLPTEAEWEYAARGGNISMGYKYAGSNDLNAVAWYSANSGFTSHIIGTKAANELGLYDMSGNVFEWCYDWYNSGYYSISPACAPLGDIGGGVRVGRGGSWNFIARDCRSARRNSTTPTFRVRDFGFRLVLQ